MLRRYSRGRGTSGCWRARPRSSRARPTWRPCLRATSPAAQRTGAPSSSSGQEQELGFRFQDSGPVDTIAKASALCMYASGAHSISVCQDFADKLERKKDMCWQPHLEATPPSAWQTDACFRTPLTPDEKARMESNCCSKPGKSSAKVILWSRATQPVGLTV